MRVLLDENIDRFAETIVRGGVRGPDGARARLAGKDERRTAPTRGARVRRIRQHGSELGIQQNLQTLKMGLVVLRASSNAYVVIAPLMLQINQALHAIQPGVVVHVPARP